MPCSKLLAEAITKQRLASIRDVPLVKEAGPGQTGLTRDEQG